MGSVDAKSKTVAIDVLFIDQLMFTFASETTTKLTHSGRSAGFAQGTKAL